jgi:hypothetical protein
MAQTNGSLTRCFHVVGMMSKGGSMIWELENEPRTAVMNKIKYPTNMGLVQYWVIIRNRNRPLMVIRSVLRIHNSFSPKQIKDPAFGQVLKDEKNQTNWPGTAGSFPILSKEV